jgi:ribosomal protein S21
MALRGLFLARMVSPWYIPSVMAINVEVSKNTNESTSNLIRRFTKRLQGAGIVPKSRNNRYHERIKSRNFSRKKRLGALKRKENYEELAKLGKLPERPVRGGRR